MESIDDDAVTTAAPRTAKDHLKLMVAETRAAAAKKRAARGGLQEDQDVDDEKPLDKPRVDKGDKAQEQAEKLAEFLKKKQLRKAQEQAEKLAGPQAQPAGKEETIAKVEASNKVDYNSGQSPKGAGQKVDAEPVGEEKAKIMVMAFSVIIRQGASKAAAQTGKEWKDMTWTERLAFLQNSGASSPEELKVLTSTGIQGMSPTKIKAVEPSSPPTFDRQSSGGTNHRQGRFEPAPRAVTSRASVQLPIRESPVRASPSVRSSAGGNTLASMKRNSTASKGNAFASMSRRQLLDYAIDDDDLLVVAGGDKSRLNEIYAFKEQLLAVADELEGLEVVKYLAKGSRGWVFVAERGPSKSKVVLKIVRMTQADACLKEWYAAQVLKESNVPNVVLTEFDVQAFARSKAPAIIDKELQDAGPAPYYVCMFQEFTSGGTLEDFVKHDKLCVDLLLKVCLDVAQTLSMMHANHIQHRDMKPENVLLEIIGDPHNPTTVVAKLADFGSAEIGDRAEGRADDIRRFGVMMYSLMTGESWMEHNLIKMDHEELLKRLQDILPDNASGALVKLPSTLKQILGQEVQMSGIVDLIKQLMVAQHATR